MLINPSPIEIAPSAQPTVHLNGTSKEELMQQHVHVMHAIDALAKAIRHAYPNGRDYLASLGGMQQIGLDEAHAKARLEMLKIWKANTEATLDHLMDQGGK